MSTRVCLAVLCLLSLCPLCVCGEASSLESRLLPLAKAHKGKVAIAVKHLGSGESYFLNADEPMPTASLIKLPVMLELYQQAEEGKVKLTDLVTVRQEDKVPGSGILTNHFSDGTTFSLRDACRLMIAFSDNTGTNLVLDKIGIMPVNKRMEAWGYPNTKINAKSFRGSTTSVAPERTKKFGLGSTTAREMIAILEDLEKCKHCRPVAKQIILNHLRKCDDKDKFPRFLPDGVDLPHKTGSVSNARTDAGILYLPVGAVALCVLSNENEDTRWKPDNAGNVLCAKVAKVVYDHFERAGSTQRAEEEDVNAIEDLIAKYAKSIDDADTSLAAKVWLDSPSVSFIHPRGHERGWKQVKENVYENLMGKIFSERKLTVKDIDIKAYGDSAVATFYWEFIAKTRSSGSTHKTQGRETQVYHKCERGWALVHVHYSPMPLIGKR
jgi:uncharacterized protein (TIGR02246 family)